MRATAIAPTPISTASAAENQSGRPPEVATLDTRTVTLTVSWAEPRPESFAQGFTAYVPACGNAWTESGEPLPLPSPKAHVRAEYGVPPGPGFDACCGVTGC